MIVAGQQYTGCEQQEWYQHRWLLRIGRNRTRFPFRVIFFHKFETLREESKEVVMVVVAL